MRDGSVMSRIHQPAYSIDGHIVTPQAFYEVACDPHRSVVVEACAGAGKTWILVSRILRALLDGAEPQQVLAITFTRKAAGEMRERLEQWLREFAASDDEARVRALMERGLAAEPARRASVVLAGLHERLLATGRAVEIRTFHGWFSQLLRAAPLEVLSELGLSPAVELIEDVDDLRADVFRRFHAEVRADETVRDDFFALVQSRGRSQVRRWLEAAWLKRVEIERADAAGTLVTSVESPQELWSGFEDLSHPAARLRRLAVSGLLAEVARGLGAQSAATPRKQGGLLEQALALPDDLQALAAARDALLTKGQLRKRLDTPGLIEATALLDEIQRAVEQHDARIEHLRMARLARVLLREYAALKRQRGLADMSDLELCALWLLRDATLAGWVQERLDQRIRHVLI
ncbi:MAG TPA: UvrD-helicase domain-containing protein, partial [Burkholderiaceae bacterium]|nr:UvrD-helicase domain-containing protein [Burkholderiaceae bacterium]